MIIRNLLIWLLIPALFVIVGCDSQKNRNNGENTVKIGVIAPLTGEKQQWGKNGRTGIETARALQPLLNGGAEPVLIIEDDQNQPELTREKLKKLVEVDKVSAVLMLSDTNTVLPGVKDADLYETPILVVFSSHPDVTRSRWVSQVMVDDLAEAKIAALYAIDERCLTRRRYCMTRRMANRLLRRSNSRKRSRRRGGWPKWSMRETGMKVIILAKSSKT